MTDNAPCRSLQKLNTSPPNCLFLCISADGPNITNSIGAADITTQTMGYPLAETLRHTLYSNVRDHGIGPCHALKVFKADMKPKWSLLLFAW